MCLSNPLSLATIRQCFASFLVSKKTFPIFGAIRAQQSQVNLGKETRKPTSWCSTSEEQPESGYCHIYQLKLGNTLFLGNFFVAANILTHIWFNCVVRLKSNSTHMWKADAKFLMGCSSHTYFSSPYQTDNYLMMLFWL